MRGIGGFAFVATDFTFAGPMTVIHRCSASEMAT